MTLPEFFAAWLPRIEAEMIDTVNTCWMPQPAWFNTMLLYHLGFADAAGTPAHVSAGKRIRPILVLLAAQACGADPASVLPAAAAVELLHNFSLIHDDIEDGDALRRGRPTVWAQWNIPQAINAGDAMFAMAHLAFLRCAERGVPADRVLRAMTVFDRCNVHLTVGQHLDMGFESRNSVSAGDYIEMISGKTGALVAACCEIGALLGGGDDALVSALGDYGRGLGRAFQLQDDILGIWGDPGKTGKAGSDLGNRKKTLPALFAAERDPQVRAAIFGDAPLDSDDVARLRALIDQAGGRAHTADAAAVAYGAGMEALESVPPGEAVTHLGDLARSLLGRDR